MDENLYRKLLSQLGEFSKTLQQDLDLKDFEFMEMDRRMIFYKVKEISGFIQDMKRIIDVHVNPDTIHAEFKKKKEEIDGTKSPIIGL
jgi:hypothetical protein